MTGAAVRRPMLAKVHIARKELGLDTPDYRALLERITGKSSAADCSDGELDRVVVEFRRLGWKPKTAAPAPAFSDKLYVRKIYAIWSEMGPMLDSGGSRKALRAYVQRQTGVTAPEFLDPVQANLVIEGLKAWRTRLEAGSR